MTPVAVFQLAGAIIASIGGGAAVLWGLSSFLAKVWVNRLLEKDRLRYQSELERVKGDYQKEIEAVRGHIAAAQRHLQGQIDRTVFVSRVHFETEFRAMQTIWAKVVNLRGLMAGVRPTFSLAPAEETAEQQDERFRRRVTAFSTALGEAKDAIFENEPFIIEALYAELHNSFLLAAQAEETSVRVHRRETDPNWYEKGEKNLGDVMVSMNRVSALIRRRIQELAVLPQQ